MVPIQMSNYGMYVFSYALMGHEMFGKGPPPELRFGSDLSITVFKTQSKYQPRFPALFPVPAGQ